MITSSKVCVLLVLLCVTHLGTLTKVNVVIASTFAVHLVDEEAGHGLEQQAEDGHSRAEAKDVPSPVHREVIQRVIDPEMDDVGQYRHDHPNQKLQGKNKREGRLSGHRWCVWLCMSVSHIFNVIMPQGNLLCNALRVEN